jgi:type VI secretion system protein VasD
MSSRQRMSASEKWLRLSVLALTGLVGACGFLGKKTEEKSAQRTELELFVAAGAALNPDPEGRASPLLVRFYVLHNESAFAAADFFSLYGSDTQTLAADIAQREERIIQPGQTLQYSFEFDPSAQYVAAIAAFRDIERSTWRGILPIEPGTAQAITVELDGNVLVVRRGTPKAGLAE